MSQAPKKPRREEPDRVAIIVPFREQLEQRRGKHLETFLRTIPKRIPSPAHIFIIVQSDDSRKFNRGALLNVGAILAIREGFTSLILHDVDLIPDEALAPVYVEPSTGAVHIGARWDRYKYPGYLGGVLKVTRDAFIAANGFPNGFWGWGGEDDAFATRLCAARVPVVKPTTGTLKDLEADVPDAPRASTRVKDGGREEWRNMTRREDVASDADEWKTNGLTSIRFRFLSTIHMSRVTMATVELTC